MDPTALVEVASFVNAFDAEAAASALRVQGIDAIVKRDDAGHMQPELWLGGVAVLVRCEDEAQARRILGGSAASHAPRRRSWVSIAAMAGALALLAVAAVWIQRQAALRLPRAVRSLLLTFVPLTIAAALFFAVVLRLRRRRRELHAGGAGARDGPRPC